VAIVKREVAVEIGSDGERRKLVFRLGINEMIAIQDEWGIKDDEEFLEAIDKPQGLRRFRILVKHALTSHQKDTTDDAAGDIITELGMPRMKEILAETVAWAFPDKDAVPDPEAKPGKVEAASPGALPS